ncbi:hypothetical protein SAMN05421780_107125 [Flexibacter flexilis DSM 6793]|uniref:HipA-like kinase domain-containing protein n=1 Tax=Flexibacter flexilis DSM 6793 TaxID=927664 RepID=A0A1I1KUM3_9BACT|nr:HipA family kinase [Flexibacter flexilis]SFC61833.1 hypothetical protein SAMN05421780_107125 [Flexibacter flexilis DSM 6793]
MPAIPLVKTVLLDTELPTDGHKPLRFWCDDGRFYFCKPLGRHRPEALFYELVCAALLEALELRVPPSAFVQIQTGSFEKKHFLKNKTEISIGFQEIAPAETVSQHISYIKNLNGNFRRPHSLLKIALFDLWVNNTNRTQSNYNLLVEETEFGKDWVAINHESCFGGTNGFLDLETPVSPTNKLISSAYFTQYKRQLRKAEACNVIEHFFSFDTKLIENEVNAIFEALPESWQIAADLPKNILDLLLCQERNESIKTLMLQTLS